MALVLIEESTYAYARLRENVFGILSTMDAGVITPGANVLIKPNLLAPARPEQAITTHPLVVKAAAEYVLEKGGKARVSDSSAMGSFEKTVSVCGIKEALQGMPVALCPLDASRVVRTEGKFGAIELSAGALDADVILNLPKLKTHTQMGLTLAVKNLFGCVVGMRKPEWHYRVGENKELFAELLVTLYTVLRPSLNLIDGILGMEGAGPGTGGAPREMRLLMGSADALSLDMAVCGLVGMAPFSLLTNRAALAMGLNGDFEISGNMPEIRDFVIPDTKDLLFGPRFLQGFLRRHITGRPKNIDETCQYCLECLKICPSGAIANPGRRLRFDYEKCIRCYCCLEVCPHGAIEKHEPMLKRLMLKYFSGSGGGQRK